MSQRRGVGGVEHVEGLAALDANDWARVISTWERMAKAIPVEVRNEPDVQEAVARLRRRLPG